MSDKVRQEIDTLIERIAKLERDNINLRRELDRLVAGIGDVEDDGDVVEVSPMYRQLPLDPLVAKAAASIIFGGRLEDDGEEMGCML